MKKKKEEEHYEIPPSSKNAKEINIQMATINPFFQESSHLPKNLQQHLSASDNHNNNNNNNTNQINRKRRGTRISLAIREAVGRKCTIHTAVILLIINILVIILFVLATYKDDIAKTWTLGYVVVIVLFQSIANQIVNMYAENKHLKTNKKALIPLLLTFLILLMCFISKLKICNPYIPQDVKKDIVIDGTKNCTVIRPTNLGGRKLTSLCFQKSRSKPYAVSLEKFYKPLSFQEKEARLENLDSFLKSSIDTLVHILGTQSLRSSKDVYECTAVLQDVWCSGLMPTCTNSCNSMPMCYNLDLCTRYEKKCGKLMQQKAKLEKMVLDILIPGSQYRKIILSALNIDPSKEPEQVEMVVIFMQVIHDITFNKLHHCTKISNYRENYKTNCFDAIKNKIKLVDDTTGMCNMKEVNETLHQYYKSMPELLNNNQKAPTTCIFIAFNNWTNIYLIAVVITNIVISNILLLYNLYTFYKAEKKKKISKGLKKFTIQIKRMTKTETSSLLLSCILCLGVTVITMLYNINFEMLLLKDLLQGKNIFGSGFIWVALYYFIAIFAFQLFLIQLTSIVRGTTSLKLQNKHADEDDHTISISDRIRIYKKVFYDDLLSFPYGKLYIQRVVISELYEMVSQFFSFEENCRNSNLYYIGFTIALLLANVSISPLLLMYQRMRKKSKKVKYIMHIVDNILDILYLSNNIFRGGEVMLKANIKFWTNMAIFFPAFSIVSKCDDIYDSIMTKEDKKSKELSLSSSFKIYLQNVREKSMSAANLFKRKKCKERLDMFQKLVFFFIWIFGLVFFSIIIANLRNQYAVCETEFGKTLWHHAHPKKFFTNGIWKPLTCGYEKIMYIHANNSDIQSLPESIGSCVSLRTLHLKNNKISSLPRGLLMLNEINNDLKDVSLEGNPVSRRISLVALRMRTFPTKFLCNHMKQLEYINASMNTIEFVDACMNTSNFPILKTLDVSFNNIQSSGLPKAMLYVANTTLENFIFTKNPISRTLKWSNRNMVDSDMKKIIAFLGNYFQKTMQHVDLSVNEITDSSLIEQFLDTMPILETLNVSSNKLISVFGIRNTFTGINKDFQDGKNLNVSTWGSLRHLYLNNNRISILYRKFINYFEMRKHNLEVQLENNEVSVFNFYGQKGDVYPDYILDKIKLQVMAYYIHPSSKNTGILMPSLDTFCCKFRNLQVFRIDFGILQTSTIAWPNTENSNCFSPLTSVVLRFVENLPKFSTAIWNLAIIRIWYPKGNIGYQHHQHLVTISMPPVHEVNNKTELIDFVGFGDSMNLNYTFPTSWESKFPNLERFCCRSCHLSGTLPRFSASRKLSYLDLSFNYFHDNLISNNIFTNMNNLNYIDLSRNPYLVGNLPTLLPKRISNIQCLFLHGTNISINIPPFEYLEQMKGLMTFTKGNYTVRHLTDRLRRRRINCYETSMTYVDSIATSVAIRMKKKVFYVCYNANYGIYKECVVQFCKKDNPFVCSGSPRVLKKRSWFNLL